MCLRWSGCGLALATAFLLLTGCGKSPQQVEAERAKAQAEWNAEVQRAERAREREEKRLVEAELERHRQQEQADDERARQDELAERAAERRRRLQLVKDQFHDPDSAMFSNVHWNLSYTALCGEVSARNRRGVYNEAMRFIVGDDKQAVIDSSQAGEHERFVRAAEAIDCSP